MTLSKQQPIKGQPVLLSIVIDSDLWSTPVKGVLRADGSYRIQSGMVWRGAVVHRRNCRVLK